MAFLTISISRLKITSTVGIGLNIIFNFIFMEWWRLLYFSAVLTFIVYLTYLYFNDGLSWNLLPTSIMLVTVGLFIYSKK